jgi:hypothetical protein
MTVYTAECAIDSDDTITATRSSNRVELEPSGRVEVYLDPADARTFARGIIALADEIDGGEVAEAATTETRTPKVGDRVRIVEDDPYVKPGAFVGRTGVLRQAEADGRGKAFRVRLDDTSDTWDDGSWWCAEVALLDEPAEPATTLEPVPVVSLRGDFVAQAKMLLAGVEHTSAADVIHLAQVLADE